MASNPDFVQYIADQCAGAGEITVKKMFGDYGIYCDGVIFGLVCDNRFYLKPTDAGRSLLPRCVHLTMAQKTISSSKMWTTAIICQHLSAKPVRHCHSRSRKRKNEINEFFS